MTNITLSIEDEIYKKMRKYSEIRWSEFVRRIIEKRINELEKLDGEDLGSSRFLADEKLLFESWASKEDEEAFAYLQ